MAPDEIERLVLIVMNERVQFPLAVITTSQPYDRDKVLKVLELGSAWTRRFRPVSADRIWLEVALVPSAPAERFVDPAHRFRVSFCLLCSRLR